MATDVNDFFGDNQSPTMPDVMIDVESMGLRPNAPLVSFGAVTFDVNTQTIGEQFYIRVNLQSCVDQGAVIDAGTVLWWLQQSDDARREITGGSQMHINHALIEFAAWLRKYTGAETATRMWCSAIDLDIVLMTEHYRRAGIKLPWKFWNQRCSRTINARYANILKDERKGTHHNALDDAIYQVEHLFKIQRELKRPKS